MNSTLPQSLANSSQISYNKHWAVFCDFMATTIKEPPLPASSYHIALYVTHLHVAKNYVPNSIRSHLSAIAFTHKLHGAIDPTESFKVTKLLDAIKRTSKPPRKRSAITKPILHQLVQSTSHHYPAKYNRRMYTCLFLIMYHACLRISEVTVSKTNNHTLTYQQSKLKNNTLQITLNSYKHSRQRHNQIRIPQTKGKHCPVMAFNKFIRVRGKEPGPLFLDVNNKGLTRSNVAAVLQKCLSTVVAKPSNYNTHSFRIGKITDLASKGTPAIQLRIAGRFNSSAYLKYIKPSVVVIP